MSSYTDELVSEFIDALNKGDQPTLSVDLVVPNVVDRDQAELQRLLDFVRVMQPGLRALGRVAPTRTIFIVQKIASERKRRQQGWAQLAALLWADS